MVMALFAYMQLALGSYSTTKFLVYEHMFVSDH